MHHRPGAILLPLAEVVIDHAPGREVMGQHAPGAAPAHHIKNAVEHFSSGVLLWSASRLGPGDVWFNQRPFVVREIGRVRFSEFHAPQFTVSFSPGEDFFHTV
jgi:hypothetical protein